MTKPVIYYWHNWINRENFQNDPIIMAKITQVLQNEPGVEVKKMINLPIYKTKLNYMERIYWTTKIVHGKPYMVMLGKIINHDYDLNIFKPGELDKFLRRNDSRLFEEALTLEQDCSAQLASSVNSFNFRHPRYYQHQFITLSEGQLPALETSKTCVALSGAAGSGKSCLLVDALQKMLVLRGKSCKKPILYVANSAKLAADIKALWGVGSSSEQEKNDVLFMGYDDLVTYLNSTYSQDNRVGEDECLTWLDHYLKQQAHTTNTPLKWLTDEWRKNKNILKTVYEEFRVISVYARAASGVIDEDHYFNEQTYIQLGIKQSLFEQSVRPALFQLYSTYLRSLPAGHWDPAFHDVKDRARFYGIAVDEALDLSLLQLMSLHSLTTKSHIYYAMDSHQRQRDRRCHRPLLLDILKRLSVDVLHVQLSGSYRSPNEIIRVCNGLIQLKIDLAGNTADGFEDRAISLSTDPDKENGEFFFIKPAKSYALSLISLPVSVTSLPKLDKPTLVKWGDDYFSYGQLSTTNWGYTPLNRVVINDAISEINLDFSKQKQIYFSSVYEKIYNHIQHQGGHKPSNFDDAVLHNLFPSIHCIVLTRQEHLAEARRCYPTTLILTPSDIKGLEYDDVICYRLFDDHEKIGKSINKQWNTLNQNGVGQPNDQFDLFLNDIIVAITRAKKRVFFVQNNDHQVQSILQKLQACPLHQRDLLTSILQHQTIRPTERDWIDHAAVLLKNGNESIAQSIFHQELKKTTEEFIEFKASLIVSAEQTHSHTTLNTPIRPKNRSNKPAKAPMTFLPIQVQTNTLIETHEERETVSIPTISESSSDLTLQTSPNSIINPTPIHLPTKKRTVDESIECLLKNFNEDNLILWFKSPKGVLYLSRTLDDGRSLLEKILSCPARRKVFCTFLKKVESSPAILNTERDLIHEIADQNYAPNESSAMHIAAISDCAGLINLFAAKGLYVESGNKYRETPLYIAFKLKAFNAIDALTSAQAELFFSDDMNPYQEIMGTFYTAVDYDLTDAMDQISYHISNKLTCPFIFQSNGDSPLIRAVQLGSTDNLRDIIQQPNVDINQQFGIKNYTALSVSVQHGKVDVVQLLLEKGAAVDQPLKSGATPLILAAQFGYLDIVRLLLKHGAHVNNRTIDGSSALLLATNFGHYEIVKTLLQHLANWELENTEGHSPKSVAQWRGHQEIVDLLNKETLLDNVAKSLAKQNPSNMIDFFKQDDVNSVKTLLCRVIFRNGSERCTLFSYYLNKPLWKPLFYDFLRSTELGNALLFEMGITALEPNGNTGLHLAAMDGHDDFITLYAEQWCVDVLNKQGETPLFTAIAYHRINVIKALIQAQASVELTTPYLLTPLHSAIRYKDGLSVCMLLKAGASNSIYKIDQYGDTCLTLAVKMGLIPIVTILLRTNSTGINTLNDKKQESALFSASHAGNVELVKLLLEHGALIDLPANNGITPLMIAVQQKHVSVAKCLLTAGADVTKTMNGMTILSMAQQSGDITLIELIRQAIKAPPCETRPLVNLGLFSVPQDKTGAPVVTFSSTTLVTQESDQTFNAVSSMSIKL